VHSRFVIISGCSGGGKSTLLAELARRGHAIIEEPGRRIVREELASGGTALPWVDERAFARRAIAMAEADLAAAGAHEGWVFFDRGLIDAQAALRHLTGAPFSAGLRGRFHEQVFMAPPWPALFAPDAERRHGFEAAESEYVRLVEAYTSLGFRLSDLPRLDVPGRADFVLASLAGHGTTG
jgi:predicted ATPase